MIPQKPGTTLSKPEALKIIRNATSRSLVFPSDHAQKKMIERDITLPEIITVLKNGKILKEPAFNVSEKNWECTVHGIVPLTGKPIMVFTAIDRSEDGVLLITIYEVKGTRLKWK